MLRTPRTPKEFLQKVADVLLGVAQFATPAQLASLDMDCPWQFANLCESTPLIEQSLWSPSQMPPVISLFRQPLLREMRKTSLGLEELVRHAVIHEAEYRFGFSDEDTHTLEEMAEDRRQQKSPPRKGWAFLARQEGFEPPAA